MDLQCWNSPWRGFVLKNELEAGTFRHNIHRSPIKYLTDPNRIHKQSNNQHNFAYMPILPLPVRFPQAPYKSASLARRAIGSNKNYENPLASLLRDRPWPQRLFPAYQRFPLYLFTSLCSGRQHQDRV